MVNTGHHKIKHFTLKKKKTKQQKTKFYDIE